MLLYYPLAPFQLHAQQLLMTMMTYYFWSSPRWKHKIYVTLDGYTRLNGYSINPVKSEVLVYHRKGKQNVNLTFDTEILTWDPRKNSASALNGPPG